MNNGPLIFLGAFLTIVFSWSGIVLTNHLQWGRMQPYYDEVEGKAFPSPMSGVAKQGKQVYQELGCIYCHSQQVRRPGFGGDTGRGWGDRQSVPRDYLHQERVLLGTMRTGPDLMTVGARPLTADWHFKHLLDPQITSPGSTMPPYPFLFETRKIQGEPSVHALTGLSGAHAPPEGYEVVPTARAEALVAYLLSLKHEYDYPEAMPVGGAP